MAKAAGIAWNPPEGLPQVRGAQQARKLSQVAAAIGERKVEDARLVQARERLLVARQAAGQKLSGSRHQGRFPGQHHLQPTARSKPQTSDTTISTGLPRRRSSA